MHHRNRYGGFTVMEVMIVAAIVSIVLGIALPTYSEHRKRVMVAQAQKDIVLISQRLETYFSLNYEYPEYLAEAGIVAMEDPWGFEYQYLNKADVDPETGTAEDGVDGPKPRERRAFGVGAINTDYDLFSVGEDGDYRPNIDNELSVDDVLRGNNGDFVDLARKY